MLPSMKYANVVFDYYIENATAPLAVDRLTVGSFVTKKFTDRGRNLGNYMVDKAECHQLDNAGQAGPDDDLKRYFPELDVPAGITFVDLEAVELMIDDWYEKPDACRPFGLALRNP
jgi:hypothetical protein